MRAVFVFAVFTGLLLGLTGCNGNADIPPDQQKAFSDRNPSDFHKPPSGMGPGGGGPPKEGAPPNNGGPPPGAAPPAGKTGGN